MRKIGPERQNYGKMPEKMRKILKFPRNNSCFEKNALSGTCRFFFKNNRNHCIKRGKIRTMEIYQEDCLNNKLKLKK